jgi:hypothetical protein
MSTGRTPVRADQESARRNPPEETRPEQFAAREQITIHLSLQVSLVLTALFLTLRSKAAGIGAQRRSFCAS